MNTIKTYVNELHNNRKFILANLLTKKEAMLPKNAAEVKNIYWDASSYDLNLSSFYNNLLDEEKNNALSSLSRSRLEEAYHIEKCGIAFGAKMILSSDSFEERKLYAHFTAEESEHLAMVESFLTNISKDGLANSFLDYLSNLIETAPKNVLTFIIQVVLEGWGIEHYNNLAKTCNSDDLKKSLNKIVQDEASHHGSGLLLFKEADLSKEELQMAVSAFETFLNMIKIGPFSVFQAVYQANNNLKNESLTFLKEIKADEQTTVRLRLLKKLALKSGATRIVEECDKKRLFDSLTPEEMSTLYEVYI